MSELNGQLGVNFEQISLTRSIILMLFCLERIDRLLESIEVKLMQIEVLDSSSNTQETFDVRRQ